MRFIIVIGFALSSLLGVADLQSAQFAGRVGGRPVVVHTNPLPVVMHRLLPPNPGRHITVKQYQASQFSRPYGARR
jgi:hypothetical protein